jgi:two-component sensor histidine kinase
MTASRTTERRSPERSLESHLEAEIAELRQQLEEKSALIDEVNHRAKTNLQMAMALLSMQAAASDSEPVKLALDAASTRLGHLARVHELMYQRADGAQIIDIGVLLGDVSSELSNALGRADVELVLDVEPIPLDAGQAISVALIAGEATLNAYKHAFPGGKRGRVEISARRQGDLIELNVRDDGVGFSTTERHGSLGMRLLRALGRSLGGETRVTSADGTEVSVTFPPGSSGPAPA